MYILSNRKKGFTKNELIELLYKDSDINDPGNTLKISIHRLRKVLAETGLPKEEYIIYQNGNYYWNKEVLTEIDTEVFEETFLKASKQEIPAEMRIELYKKAVELCPCS